MFPLMYLAFKPIFSNLLTMYQLEQRLNAQIAQIQCRHKGYYNIYIATNAHLQQLLQ